MKSNIYQFHVLSIPVERSIVIALVLKNYHDVFIINKYKSFYHLLLIYNLRPSINQFSPVLSICSVPFVNILQSSFYSLINKTSLVELLEKKLDQTFISKLALLRGYQCNK